MEISKQAVEAAYQKQAKHYDAAMKLYKLAGLRMDEYRARVVALLRLKRGDSVVDLGCGTGLSFPLLTRAIGPEGRLIGVDISAAMLARADERTKRSGWTNVHLVQAELAVYELPQGVDAALSTGVLGYVPERAQVLEKIARRLRPGGRVVIMDGKRPDRWPRWLFRLFVTCSGPYGVTEAYFDNQTWKAVERYFHDTTFEEMYGGLMYISAGTAALKPA